jgi:hypothetical protein
MEFKIVKLKAVITRVWDGCAGVGAWKRVIGFGQCML